MNARPLSEVAKLFKTPTANLGKQVSAGQHPDKRKAGGHGPNLADEVTHLLPTPKASDGPHGGPNQRSSKGVYDALPGAGVHLLPTLTKSDGTGGPGTSPGREGGMNLRTAVTCLEERWGVFAPAIARQERLIGRPAPTPTQIGPRGGVQLAQRFAEWLMGLPAGWVTDVVTDRKNALIVLGNGVVPDQAEAAFRHLMADWPEPKEEQ